MLNTHTRTHAHTHTHTCTSPFRQFLCPLDAVHYYINKNFDVIFVCYVSHDSNRTFSETVIVTECSVEYTIKGTILLIFELKMTPSWDR